MLVAVLVIDTYSLIPSRNPRRAVTGHQYRETMAAHSAPMMTVAERKMAMRQTG